ncbi:hypothetical protein LEP1GSC049_2531 [Leptospira kirschneri serovar Cynopteri str. 3522 CT]|nr:hypothetical protein LEP1GSC049_2531 [Leptospira kirschneri serovar Cynopteri str. 3522 CT]
MFQNLECVVLLKKLIILGLAQFRENFYIFKKILVILSIFFHTSE